VSIGRDFLNKLFESATPDHNVIKWRHPPHLPGLTFVEIHMPIVQNPHGHYANPKVDCENYGNHYANPKVDYENYGNHYGMEHARYRPLCGILLPLWKIWLTPTSSPNFLTGTLPGTMAWTWKAP
jgi:hypothetical protein